MYVNAKMMPVETVPGIWRKMKESSEGDVSSMIYLKHCKNLCKCCNVSPPSTTTKKKLKKDKIFKEIPSKDQTCKSWALKKNRYKPKMHVIYSTK
jgi:hypothetical protein